jgi:hypothetical protein
MPKEKIPAIASYNANGDFELGPLNTPAQVRKEIVRVMQNLSQFDARREYLYAIQLALATFPKRGNDGK